MSAASSRIAGRIAGRADAATDTAMAAAYSATGRRWRDGPGVIYDRLADVLVAHAPISVRDACVVDIGAGTGAASRAACRAGARSVVAIDAAAGMLAVDAHRRPPSVVADAARLPFAAAHFDLAVAAFSFNHLDDPAVGLREAARVVRPGGAVIASAYASDDQHPVKVAVEQSLRDLGWTPDAWQAAMYRDRAPQLASRAGCADAVDRAALGAAGFDATVTNVRVDFGDLRPEELVAWRLGMAQHAPFVAALAPHEQAVLTAAVLARLGDAPPLVRSIMVIVLRG